MNDLLGRLASHSFKIAALGTLIAGTAMALEYFNVEPVWFWLKPALLLIGIAAFLLASVLGVDSNSRNSKGNK